MDFFAWLTQGKCPSATRSGGIAAEGFWRISFLIERCEALAANNKNRGLAMLYLLALSSAVGGIRRAISSSGMPV